jgi:hypothetical protein
MIAATQPVFQKTAVERRAHNLRGSFLHALRAPVALRSVNEMT